MRSSRWKIESCNHGFKVTRTRKAAERWVHRTVPPKCKPVIFPRATMVPPYRGRTAYASAPRRASALRLVASALEQQTPRLASPRSLAGLPGLRPAGAPRRMRGSLTSARAARGHGPRAGLQKIMAYQLIGARAHQTQVAQIGGTASPQALSPATSEGARHAKPHSTCCCDENSRGSRDPLPLPLYSGQFRLAFRSPLWPS